MRSRTEIYRANAEVCGQQAAVPRNASQRERWIRLAEQWSKLAEGAKKDPARIGRAKHTSRPVSRNSRPRHALGAGEPR
jgi:hypothetical protein